MADEASIAAKLQKENSEKFKKTISAFHESVVMSEIAAAEVEAGGVALQEMKGVWKDEVSAPMKGMVAGFTNMIPGFGLASKMTLLAAKTGWSHFRGAKKQQKIQEKQLLEALGLTKKEMEAHQKRQASIKAETAVMENLQSAAQEWGLVAKDFDAANEARKILDAEEGVHLADLRHLNDTEIKIAEQQAVVLKLQEEQAKEVQSKSEKEGTIKSEEVAEKQPDVQPDVIPKTDVLPKLDPKAFLLTGKTQEKAQEQPDVQPDVIPETDVLPKLDPKAFLLTSKTQESIAAFAAAATTPGSIFVHDKAVEDELESQANKTGAAAKEQANEQRRKDDRLIDTLEGIEDNTGDLKGIKKSTDKKGKSFLASLLGGGGLMGGASTAMASMGAKFLPGGAAGLKALAPKALSFLKVAGPIGIIIGGVVAAAAMVKSGVEGYNKAASGEWPVDKVSGAIGGALGGTGKGWANAGKQALKGAGVGALIGLSVGGPVGALIGGVVGAAAGGIAGFIGGETIATWADTAVGSVRNLFNLPELLTPEQTAAAKTRLEEITKEVTAFDTQIETLELSLKEGNLTGKARIDAMNELAALEASKAELGEEQAKINQRMANNLIAEKQASVKRASEEFNNAAKSAQQEKNKLFWIALRYGKDSDEYEAQIARHDAAAQWEKDSKEKLVAEELARAAAQKEHDEKHKTMMGNVRLFWGSFKDSLPSWSDVKEGASAFIKDPLGTMKTTFSKFIPDITLPSWDTVKEGVTGFFKDPASSISTAFSAFKAVMPDMEAIKNHLPDSLVAAGEWAADKLPLLKAGLAGVALPALDLIKANMPDSLKAAGEWATDKITGLKDKLKDISLPSMATIAASMPDILTGAGDWAQEKMTAWKDALPEIKLPDVSQVMGDISDMATNAASKVKGFFKGLFSKGEPEKEEAEKDIKEQLDTLEKRRKFFKEATEKEWTKHFDNTEYGDVYKDQKELLKQLWKEEPDAYKNEMELLQEARSQAMDTVLGITMSAKDEVTTDKAGNEVASSMVKTVNALGFAETAMMKMTTEVGGRVTKSGKVVDKTTAESDYTVDPEMAKFMAEAAKEAARPKMEQSLDAAVDAGFYNIDWVGASEIDRKALQEGVNSGLIQKEMLDNIIADKDLRDEDLQFMKTLVEQATTGESLHVRDKGIHDRLDHFITATSMQKGNDFAMNAFRMASANNTAGAGGRAPTLISNVIAPSTVTSQSAKTTIETLVGISDPHTQLARAY